jgi:two-component system nitrate/nitrite response regulator NarL
VSLDAPAPVGRTTGRAACDHARVRLLICDDHRIFGDSLGIALSGRGHDVVAVTEQPAQAAAVLQGGAEVDLVIMDLAFPDADGVDTTVDLLRRWPGLLVMILTGSSDPQLLPRAVRAGAAGVVAKSRGLEHVLEAIDRVAAGELHVDAELLRQSFGRSSAEQVQAQLSVQLLTDRERETLSRLVNGESTDAMAAGMGVGVTTVRSHVRAVLSKLGVHSRLEAVALAVQTGMALERG